MCLMGEAQFVNMGVTAETFTVGSRGFSEEVTLNREQKSVPRWQIKVFFFFFQIKDFKGDFNGESPQIPIKQF